ncbi:MAG: hypothetical protein MJ247_01275 [Alphaproteobacteria bacterium]|nr:hypothetical protein [Alphaproteobacteria bacterium]
MEKENKLAAEQETKDTEIVELKDEDLKTVSAGELTVSIVVNGQTYASSGIFLEPLENE